MAMPHEQADLAAKCLHELNLLTSNEKLLFVMPAWIAGIQSLEDACRDIHVGLIPALHAGMTELKSSAGPEQNFFGVIFKVHEAVVCELVHLVPLLRICCGVWRRAGIEAGLAI
jgi:hypothetical protein